MPPQPALKRPSEAEIDEAIEESFPASDPPALRLEPVRVPLAEKENAPHPGAASLQIVVEPKGRAKRRPSR